MTIFSPSFKIFFKNYFFKISISNFIFLAIKNFFNQRPPIRFYKIFIKFIKLFKSALKLKGLHHQHNLINPRHHNQDNGNFDNQSPKHPDKKNLISNPPNFKTAFSLVEMSIVILVIGILIIGISNGIELYQDTKLSTARSLTSNSRVGRINGLVLWLETTLENNFSIGATDFNNIKSITENTSINRWRDINPLSISPNNATQTNSSNQPKIIIDKDSMLPMVNFTKTSSQYLKLPDGTIPFGNSEYTFILVSKLYTLGSCVAISSGTHANNLANSFKYSLSGKFINYWWSTPLDISMSILVKSTNIIIITYDQNIRNGYVDGKLISTTTQKNRNSTQLNNFIGGSINIADYFDGDIGEIVVYDRALTEKERQDIEKYLSKKWNIKI